MEEIKKNIKRKIGEDNDDKVYKFKVILPNRSFVELSIRNPVQKMMSLEKFVEGVKVKHLRQMPESSGKYERKIYWNSKELYLEDCHRKKIRGNILYDDFKPNKTHVLRLYDGAGQTVDESEIMWDLTPDTDLLSELPDDYTFETALADLIDNSLQAVWSNAKDERKLISIEVDVDRVSVFDTGPGMDNSAEKSIAKWGKMGASLHRSSKKLAIGGKPPYLTPYFGMFGYGGTIASMHLGRHAVVSGKTKESNKVYWLRLERDALLKRAGSGPLVNWKVPGGDREPSDDEMEKATHGSFLKVVMEPKLKVPDIFQLQCKLKDIYFPYIQCDEIAGRTATPVEFQVNGINLAEIDGGEVAITNLHSCNGPEFIVDIHFSIDEDNAAIKCQSKKEANARLKCAYFPIVEGKESVERILEKLNTDGCGIKEDFLSFSRISIRRLGRLLPDARWDLLPFMKPKQKRGDKVRILKRCCLRVKCFIDTDAGFNPIPSKTDLALHHPFTKALKELGGDPPRKGVKVQMSKDGNRLSLLQLEREYQNWILQMHSEYDEEPCSGDDEPVFLINVPNKEKLGITSNVVRVHQAMSWKGRSWKRGQKVKILKGACPGCHKTNIFATLEYFLLEGLQGDAGGEARVICRPQDVQVQDGAALIDSPSIAFELRGSLSLPITVIDSGKFIPLGDDDWHCQLGKLNVKWPSAIEVLSPKHCNAFDIDGGLSSGTIVSAGHTPPKGLVAILRPPNFSSKSVANPLDQKYIMKENHELCMEVSFKTDAAESSEASHIYSASVTNTSLRGCAGLYHFPLSSIPYLFQKAGVYVFSFKVKNIASINCEISVQVKACTKIERWKLSKDAQNVSFNVSAGSCFPQFSVARYDKYDNCVPFNTIPDIEVQLMSDGFVLSSINKVKVDISPDKCHLIVKNLRVTANNLDKIRPTYGATLLLSQPNEVGILRIPCQVVPGPPKSAMFHLSESGNRWLPRQVVEDIRLEIFDRFENHVKAGTEVQLELHGLCSIDLIGLKRKVDDDGFVDLSGILKVEEGYGKPVSIGVLSNGQVLIRKVVHIEKRELRIATVVPDICQAGSRLKDLTFEIVDPKGEVDESIHDDDKHNSPHTLKIRTDPSEADDFLRYVFRKGRCVIPSIKFPKIEGKFCIEAYHCQHPELDFKFEVTVSQATADNDVISNLQTLEGDSDGISQSENYRTTPDTISTATEELLTSVGSKFRGKKDNVLLPVRECDFSSPLQTSDPMKMSERFVGEFAVHPCSFVPERVATSMESESTQKQTGYSQISNNYCHPDHKDDDHMFESPDSKFTCPDFLTPEKAISLLGPEFESIKDAEKDILHHGSCIKEHEDQLDYLELRKKILKELLQIQVSTQPVPLSVSNCMSVKEVLMENIENKVESAAALYSIVSRDTSLRSRHPMFMDDVVGLVALLGTTPTHLLSCSLAEYLGEDQMLALVCQSTAAITTTEKYELVLNSYAAELGKCIKGSHLIICLEDIRVFGGGVLEDDYQKRLALPKPILPDGTTPPGFLGYAVNLIDIDEDHLQTKTEAGHGLRETLFYRLFGELQVYETKDDMKQAYTHGCARDGVLSLDGGIIRGNGMILLGLRQLDVHFPVVAHQNQLTLSLEATDGTKQLDDLAREKQQQIEEYEEEMSLVNESISYVSQQLIEEKQQFSWKKSELEKLLEAKKASLSQWSLHTTPISFPSPSEYSSRD